MKRLLLLTLCLATLAATAQPPARRRAAQEKKEQAEAKRGAAYRDFPTAQSMPDDVAWRRDVYRSLDLTKDANAPLYYPVTPQDGRENLFVFIFHLMLRGEINAYDYTLDGRENFSEKNRVKPRAILDRYKVLYETKGEKFRVADADLPSDQVKLYFIKESSYYDRHTGTFRKSVSAICPVLKRGDDFGGADAQYPMFWVKYADLAPHLGQLMLTSSNLNNAATMSADDYFTMGVYDGDIYKVDNLQDLVLANYCPTDSSLVKERRRIERQFVDFEDRMWGRDSVAMAKAALEKAKTDSIAAAEEKTSRSARRGRTRRSSSSASEKSEKTPEVKQKRQRATRPRSSGSGLSVRRQRH